MGAVCSAGMAGENAELGGKSLGFSGKILRKENSFTNRKDSDSKSNDQGKKQRNKENGFSNEFGLSTSASMGEKQVLPFILSLSVCMLYGLLLDYGD